jgi:hypothetical protein
MILEAAGERIIGSVLENGCGVGTYVRHLTAYGENIIGLEYDFERTREALRTSPHILCAGKITFWRWTFDFILSLVSTRSG